MTFLFHLSSPRAKVSLKRRGTRLTDHVRRLPRSLQFLQSLDKGTMSFAAIMNIREDTGMVGQQCEHPWPRLVLLAVLRNGRRRSCGVRCVPRLMLLLLHRRLAHHNPLPWYSRHGMACVACCESPRGPIARIPPRHRFGTDPARCLAHRRRYNVSPSESFWASWSWAGESPLDAPLLATTGPVSW